MALFEAIRERQRRNLVRKDDPRSLALRKRQGFDLSERQIGECLLCASPNAVKVMTIEHHLEDVILDDLHAAFVVIGKNGLSPVARSEEHTSELQSLMRISYAVFCLNKKKNDIQSTHAYEHN